MSIKFNGIFKKINFILLPDTKWLILFHRPDACQTWQEGTVDNRIHGISYTKAEQPKIQAREFPAGTALSHDMDL